MVTTSSVSTWTALIQQFFPVFTAPGAQIFLALVTGWVLCTGRHTITSILPFADPAGQHAHDAFHRFLPDARWDMDALWKLLTVLLVQTFAASGVVELDLDDTLFHRCGRKVCGAGWWRDAVRSTRTRTVSAWGLNLVVLTLRVYPPWGGEPLGLPIRMRLHRKGGASLIDLAQEMLQQVAAWLPERAFRLHADGFYATLAGRSLVRIHLISRMRRDADLYEPLRATGGKRKSGRPRKKGRALSPPSRWLAASTPGDPSPRSNGARSGSVGSMPGESFGITSARPRCCWSSAGTPKARNTTISSSRPTCR
jgi:hypothetical protein